MSATAIPEKTALATVAAPNVGRELNFGMDREKVELLKRTVAKGTTDDQFALFITIAQRRKLDPFAKQIWCVLRKNKDGTTEMSVQTSIDGFRLIAQRTGEYDGQDRPLWCGEDGVWKDVWLTKEAPKAALVFAYRKGIERPFVGIAHLVSYASYKDDGKTLAAKWQQMPEHMLAKCAEALALRKAFPEDLSGIYTEDEMGREDAIDVPSVEKLSLPPAAAAPAVDPWTLFLADLASLPGIGQHVDKLGPVDMWTEEELTFVLTGMFQGAASVRNLNELFGPWASVLKSHAATSTRVARFKESISEPYKLRTAALRAAEKAQAAADGPATEGAS